jgi:CMP/dCMP kinase
MRITISGLPGSGTTSLARLLAEKYDYALISAGEVFRQMAKEHGLDLAAFGALAEREPSYDMKIDARQKEIAEAGSDIIAEGRLSGWMVGNADLKIWLMAPISCRVKRIQFRDEVSEEETAMHMTLEREKCEAQRYLSYYKIDISDFSPYHLVLNSEHWGVEQLADIVGTAISATKS